MEFGYVQAPHKTFPVVFDSPRDRGLKDFPVRSILVSSPFLPCPAWQPPKNWDKSFYLILNWDKTLYFLRFRGRKLQHRGFGDEVLRCRQLHFL